VDASIYDKNEVEGEKFAVGRENRHTVKKEN